ncbi:heme-dependent oxidative N-demethylase subunit alpha family protein [Pseudorhodoferax sp.]|uniref:heme-dependent oxidative N-demethylase subunit alpha family protein n=1 Tax=Pseudorhodoferax sp. TaxID=1993553 RepID=UPI002DD69FCF|nr:heme-dependent oxidative N-demethylase subunit alpha family protein [Pseudorhodoferax sp.]
MPFDFDAAVQAPFRMQPGLRRLPPAAAQLTPMPADGAHWREKLAVLSTRAGQALCSAPGFDPAPALQRLCCHAAAEQPAAWTWDGHEAGAPALGLAVAEGHVRALHAGANAQALQCLQALPAGWRLAGLLSLAFAEDFAILDAASTRIPWLAVALPSHWAPERKVGRPFAEVHAPVADNALLLQAAQGLAQLVSGAAHWERFVWTVVPYNQLHTHPDHVPAHGWAGVEVAAAWWRTERQTFIPVPGAAQAVFTILVQVQPLVQALAAPGRAAQLHAAVASMSPAVLAYRGMAPVRDALLDWLAARC